MLSVACERVLCAVSPPSPSLSLSLQRASRARGPASPAAGFPRVLGTEEAGVSAVPACRKHALVAREVSTSSRRLRAPQVALGARTFISRNAGLT